MLVSSEDQIDELKNYWTDAEFKNYELILSSHLMPVDEKAIEYQLEYLEIEKLTFFADHLTNAIRFRGNTSNE